MTRQPVLTIIPAKAHSRRVPGKNMRCVGGVPLMVRAVEQARTSGVCGLIHVATDDEGIAALAREAGADVPFLRRDDVDDVTSVGRAAANALRRYREELGARFDYVCLLLATSPLRAPEDIVGCRDLLLADPGLDAAGSVVQAEKHPAWAWTVDAAGRMVSLFPELRDMEREDLPPAYFYDGAVYWAKADFFESVDGNQYRGGIAPYVMPPERAVDVDTPLDLALADLLARKEDAPC
ncbi:acylneuraminate cytidylyltransferase family protein [Pseudodesulfovibrio methanolicus]|uniref:Acylneuraminate cytidylyltransferase family protein n=1 Tax=Pseudodesulfovibrio methanolicus TaxID=3126690 RepID=A0ABZ2IX15_9BACT